MTRPATVVAIGEVLYDVFPDGPRFGGAPANFITHLARLGVPDVRPILVSAVGDDDLGRRATGTLADRGVATDFLTRVDAPTGQVLVTLDDRGHPSYEIAAPAAWDEIVWTESLADLAATADAVCFGTLGQRAEPSASTIRRFVAATPPAALRILDVNLRPPFVDRDIVRDSLGLASVVKLNDDELMTLTGWFDLPDVPNLAAWELIEAFDLDLVVLTLGPDGAVVFPAGGEAIHRPSPSTTVVDTVGAGDALTAAVAVGLLRRRPLATIVAQAVAVAAYVCSQAGATPALPADFVDPPA